MVKDLRLARLGLGDQGLVEDIEDILADLLEFGLDLLTVIADGADMLIGALRLLFLLDRGDDAPRCSPCADYVLVCDREKVSLIDSQFAANLVLELERSEDTWVRDAQDKWISGGCSTFATSCTHISIVIGYSDCIQRSPSCT